MGANDVITREHCLSPLPFHAGFHRYLLEYSGLNSSLRFLGFIISPRLIQCLSLITQYLLNIVCHKRISILLHSKCQAGFCNKTFKFRDTRR